MNRWLLVQALGADMAAPVPGPAEPVTWIAASTQGADAPQTGSLAELKMAARGAGVVVLAPAEAVLTTRVILPTRQRQKVRQALPFTLEDQLTEDLEALHFAAGPQDRMGRVTAAVVNRALMTAWCDWLDDNGLSHARLLPENLLSGADERTWALIWAPDRARLATASEAFTLAPEDILAACRSYLAMRDPEERPERISVLPVAPARELPEGLAAIAADHNIALAQQEVAADWLTALGSRFEPNLGPELRQGPFAPRRNDATLKKRAAIAAALAVLWFGVESTTVALDNRQMAQEAEQLQDEVHATFRQALPDTRLVNPRHQMEQALGAAGNDGNEEPLLTLLSAAGPHLAERQGLSIQNLRYRDGHLELSLRTANLQTIETLRTALSNEAGLTARLQSATTGDNAVHAELHIRKGAS